MPAARLVRRCPRSIAVTRAHICRRPAGPVAAVAALVTLIAATRSRAEAPPPPAAQAAAARAILDDWHAEDPRAATRVLRIVAWRSADRPFPTDQAARLDRILTHIERFFAAEMARHGFGPRTIRPERDAAGRLVVHGVTGRDAWTDYGTRDGGRIREECRAPLRAAGIDIDRETVMIFTNLATWDPVAGTFAHRSPYYASGGARSGTAWQCDSPELDTLHLAAREPLVQDTEYGRIPLGRHVSIFIGGMAHELGHALGLPHCRARDDEAARGTALMGAGNRTYGEELRGEGPGTFLTLAHALRLASHPQFSGSIKGLDDPAVASFTDLAVARADDGLSFTVAGRVTGTPPVYALVGYLDPAGGGDYDARTVTAVPGADGRFVLPCTALVTGRTADLRIVACHTNGAVTSLEQTYTVAGAGGVDVDTMRLAFALRPFVAALAAGEAAARAALPAEAAAGRIAAAVLAGRFGPRGPAAAEIPADADHWPLSRMEPTEATVGWLQPAYDHLPRPEAVIESAGRIFESGIYAHAPARHRYALGRRWRRLEGGCGLPTGSGGSVEFAIRTDGREVFRSRRLGAGTMETFDVDLTGVDELELVTTDAGDGKAADWGVWLEPVLRRAVPVPR
jgi:hypothetical protein